MKQDCWIITYRNYMGDDGSWAFFNKEDAVKSVNEDYKDVFDALKKDGHDPKRYRDDEFYKELYVPNTDIYYEWRIEHSTIE